MKIAIIGTRGIPARYGGFETCAEEISTALAARGHRVLVSCRTYLYPEKIHSYKGVELVYLPSLRFKATDTFTHTLLSMIRVLVWCPDVILIFNSANSPVALLATFFCKRVVINVDGFEWKRGKWGPVARVYYRFAAFFAALVADAVVADARVIGDYYRRRFKRDSVFIPYGAHPFSSTNPAVVNRFGLEPFRYLFMGSRVEPENNHALVIDEYQKSGIAIPLVIAGNTSTGRYSRSLAKKTNRQIRFIGTVYDPAVYRELQANAALYIHGNEVGGTNPALLSAMGAGACVLALDVPPNREVLGGAGFYFTKESGDLAKKIRYLLSDSEAHAKRAQARARAIEKYSWQEVVDAYEKLFIAATCTRQPLTR